MGGGYAGSAGGGGMFDVRLSDGIAAGLIAGQLADGLDVGLIA